MQIVLLSVGDETILHKDKKDEGWDSKEEKINKLGGNTHWKCKFQGYVADAT